MKIFLSLFVFLDGVYIAVRAVFFSSTFILPAGMSVEEAQAGLLVVGLACSALGALCLLAELEERRKVRRLLEE